MSVILKRKADKVLEEWLHSKGALLVDGVRQVGKSFTIREFGKKNFATFVEMNFIVHPEIIPALKAACNPQQKDIDGLLLAISSLSSKPLKKGETLIFFDEIQEAKELDLLTLAKFLVQDGRYRYIFSGSLLGVSDLFVDSYPVGFLSHLQMYPLDFEEFLVASGVQANVITHLRDCFHKRIPVNEAVHERTLNLWYRYLLIGGMPEAVSNYLENNDLVSLNQVFSKIDIDYRKDITKRAKEEKKPYIEQIYDSLPESINAKNKRFVLSKIGKKYQFRALENDFVWLKKAGVAIPVYAVSEPIPPLRLSVESRLMKLFASDVGLLDYALRDSSSQLNIMAKDGQTNFGSIYENAVAQELNAHGFSRLYYYAKKSEGEVDFLIEYQGKVLPIEIKSGTHLKEHASLSKMLANPSYHLEEGFVFGDTNFFQDGNISYFPIYLIDFVHSETEFTKEERKLPKIDIPTLP